MTLKLLAHTMHQISTLYGPQINSPRKKKRSLEYNNLQSLSLEATSVKLLKINKLHI